MTDDEREERELRIKLMPKTHGLSYANGKRTRLHMAWMNMRNRCSNPKDPRFRDYGGRGIVVCERWNDFTAFAQDVGSPPGQGYTLDRIDNDGNYEPGNVRWADQQTQVRNQRRTKTTPEIAAQMRAMYQPRRITQQHLADMFDCDRSMVGYIVRGVNWK